MPSITKYPNHMDARIVIIFIVIMAIFAHKCFCAWVTMKIAIDFMVIKTPISQDISRIKGIACIQGLGSLYQMGWFIIINSEMMMAIQGIMLIK